MHSGHPLLNRFWKNLIGFGLGFCLLACQSQPPHPLPTLAPTLTPSPAPATFTPTGSLAPFVNTTFNPTETPVSLPTTQTPPPSLTLTPTLTFSSAPTTILFTGDINPGRCPAQKSLANNDFTLPYKAIGADLSIADLTIGSLDGSISNISPPSPCPQTLNLIGPSRAVEGLSFAGFDLLTIATNHVKDCGRWGFGCEDRSFRDTLKYLQAGGIATVGGGETEDAARQPVLLTVNGVRFAFLAVDEINPDVWATATTPGVAPLSEATLPRLLADIAAAKAQAEVVVVLPQWGVEYTDFPADYQLAWAKQMIDAGATLVIGNHPHLIQPIEEFKNPDGSLKGLVAYALGNFVFDQGPWRTRQGLVLQVEFTGATLTGWAARPTHIHSLYLVQWADPTETQAILDRLAEANAQLPQR